MTHYFVPATRSNRVASFVVAVVAILALIACAGATRASAQPTISITSGPAEGSSTNASSVTFALLATAPATKDVDFFCSIDDAVTFYACDAVSFPTCVAAGAGTQSCTQSKSYPIPTQGDHVFRAFAADCDSPCDPSLTGTEGPLVTRSFNLDRTAPTVSVSGGPSMTSPLLSGAATFTLAPSEPGTLSCALNAAGPVPCTSPYITTDFANGVNNLTIRATDRAGNISPPLTHQFMVDIFKAKKCKKPRGKGAKRAKAKVKYRKCVKANAKAKSVWKKKHGLQ